MKPWQLPRGANSVVTQKLPSSPPVADPGAIGAQQVKGDRRALAHNAKPRGVSTSAFLIAVALDTIATEDAAGCQAAEAGGGQRAAEAVGANS